MKKERKVEPKGFSTFEEVRKPVKLKPTEKKVTKNWKNLIFEQDEDDPVLEYRKNKSEDFYDEEE